MKRIIPIAIVLLTFASQSFAAGRWKTSISEAQREARKSDQLILADMYADWCGWCKKMEREVFPAQVFQQATDKMVLLRVDTEDRKEGTQFSRSIGIRSLPTLLILDAELTVVGVLAGYQPAEALAENLQAAQTDYRAFQARHARAGKSSSEPSLRLAVAKELIIRRNFAEGERRLAALLEVKSLPEAIREDAYYHLAVAQAAQQKLDAASSTLDRFAAIQARNSDVKKDRLTLAEFHIRGDDQNPQIQILFPDVYTSFVHLLPQVRNSVKSR